MPVNLPDDFLKERYGVDQRYIYVYDIYTPNYNRSIVTSKFYSKYEGGPVVVDDVRLEKLKKAKDRGPKEKRQWPETSSQILVILEYFNYGWFCTPFVDLDRNDSRLYFPRRASEMTKHAEKVLQSQVGGKK